MRRSPLHPAGAEEVALLLLRAALTDGERARSAWERAIASIGSVGELSGETYRLLPLLYLNLREQGVDAPELERLKGVYRHSWYTNHMLFHDAAASLTAFEGAGIETIVLKGGALSQLYYDAPGTRPMEDVDVLVRGRQAREAIAVLERDGWRLNVATPLECLLRTRHSAEWLHPSGRKLDLHWSPLWEPTDEEPFWERSIPLEIGGARTLALCPEDQLLHICVHGVDWHMRTPYWAADAAMLVRSTEGELDWDRVVDQARANRLSLALEHGLRFLDEQLDLQIPSAVLVQLGATPRSLPERLAHRIALAPPYRGGYTVRSWLRYRRQAEREGRRASLAGFATYQRQFWGLASRRQLLGSLLAKSAEIARDGILSAKGNGAQAEPRTNQARAVSVNGPGGEPSLRKHASRSASRPSSSSPVQ